ncbi:MAG: cobalt-precorrin-7 (C(5))-methyltransferase [Halobacterium sp.]
MSEEYDRDAGPDPATLAAAAPERPRGDAEAPERPQSDAGSPVSAVGIGPGNPEYLTRRGARVIREADVVVGFETVVDFVADETAADLLTCGYADEAETLDAFAQRVADGDRGTAVLMGDPNHSGYQFLGKVERAVDAPVRVVPGVSSLQVAASRARTPMEDAEFVTLHKSGDLDADLDRLVGAVGDRHLLVLPRPFDWMPGDVAALLVDSGADAGLDALVLERLTHEDERVTRTTLGDLCDSAGGTGAESTPYSDLSVLVVRAEEGA